MQIQYSFNLKDVQQITLPDDSLQPNWLAIPLQCDDRLGLLHFLESRDVQTRVTFSGTADSFILQTATLSL